MSGRREAPGPEPTPSGEPGGADRGGAGRGVAGEGEPSPGAPGTAEARAALKERALRLLAARPYTRARLAELLAQGPRGRPRTPRRERPRGGTSGPAARQEGAGRKRRSARDFAQLAAASKEDVDAVLEDLARVGLVDDEAYAATFAEQSLRSRPESPSRLAARLVARGVPPDVARKAAAEAVGESDEVELARRALDRAWNRFAGLPRDALLRRAGGFLVRRGFSEHAAWTAVKERLG